MIIEVPFYWVDKYPDRGGGGDFTNSDTPHFDKQIISVVDYKYKYFFNQRMISENQKIPLIT